MPIKLVMPSSHLLLCCPLLLLPSIFPSFRVFSNESVLHIRWPKYWSFSFSISPSNAYSGLISSGIDWFDLLAVQGTLKQTKALILCLRYFFREQEKSLPKFLLDNTSLPFSNPPILHKTTSAKNNMMDEIRITCLHNFTNCSKKEENRFQICTIRYGIILLGCKPPSYYWKLLLRYHSFYKVECGGVRKHSESFPKILLREVCK